jgi:hypothetical protein
VAALVMQKAFSSGEWAPELYARVDLAKYHAAAALLRNFFVDYRGGASTRAGTKYILQAFKSSTKVRLIPFQASFTVNYALEFGNFYIRFFNNGAPVLESGFAITAITNANPGGFTIPGAPYAVGDWIFISGATGMTQVNGNYYVVSGAGQLSDLFGNVVNTTAFGVYTGNGIAQRVYTLPSPYASADLALVKFAQSVNSLILCHPNYAPQVLTLVSAANWTINAINFGPTIATPTISSVVSTMGAGAVNYAYTVTAVDINGQESGPAVTGVLVNKADLRTNAGTNTISWAVIPGAVSYNVYKTEVSLAGAVPAGQQFGFIGNSTGTSFVDSNIAPDFSQCPPVVQNPFAGASVLLLTLTGDANYTIVPGVTIAAPSSGLQATAYVVLSVGAFTGSTIVVNSPGGGGGGPSPVGQTINFNFGGVVGQISSATPAGGNNWNVTGITIVSGGSVVGVGNATLSPLTPTGIVGGASYVSGNASVTWHIGALVLVSGGFGYTATPAVTFSAGAATATATLSPASGGNPSVPGFLDERLVLAAQPQALQTFYMSQPGSPYNFNVTNPILPDDAITGSIVSGKLNAIRSMLQAPTGLIMFTSQQAWLINGGASGAPVTPIDIAAKGHAYNGASDVPPLQINFDFLYVQAKGSIVRDLTFNFYTQIYTGTDISVLSSHLLFGYQITEWAYAEVPFSVVWAVRNDGALLSLTYVKEQEMIGWAHHDTQGTFQSVVSITEPAEPGPGSSVVGTIDAVYVVVQRTVNGQTIQYIERMADRFPQDGYKSCWAVDSGLQYSGAPKTNFALPHLPNTNIVGLSNGVPFTALTDANGAFVLPATPVATAGLAFVPQLQTLNIEVGDPTIQGKLKNIPADILRVRSTLGLSIGKNFTTLVPMKDLIRGNVNSMATGLPSSQQVVNDLWTGDAKTYLDSSWSTGGQYCIEQDQPFYATVLGTIPMLAVGG